MNNQDCSHELTVLLQYIKVFDCTKKYFDLFVHIAHILSILTISHAIKILNGVLVMRIVFIFLAIFGLHIA